MEAEREQLPPRHGGEVPEPPRVQHWDVSDRVGSSDAVGQWSHVLANTHVAFETRRSAATPDVFRASVTSRQIDDLMLVDCECGPFIGHRGASLVNDPARSTLGLQVVRRGSELAYASGERDVSTAGHVKLWNSWEPVDIEVIEPFVKRTLIFPLERVLAMCPLISNVNTLPALRTDGATRLLVRYLDALAVEHSSLDGADATVAAEVALELFRAAVEPGLPASRAARRQALRSDIRRYVRGRLQDPALDPELIARAHAMSVRTLHALFEETEESVAALVRRERLLRCREDLERPLGGGVTEIAFRWGFRDAGHFSRIFKREFGLTPREVRQVACDAD